MPSAIRLSFLLFACLLALALPARAIGLDRSLAQLEHTSWTARNGAPEGITSMVQGTDGWLWLGTKQGLYRFDGVRFERIRALPDRRIYELYADRDGGLWIAWILGDLTYYRHGVARHWTVRDGLPPGTLWSFARTGDTLWVSGIHGLARYDGNTWRRAGPADGFTAEKASGVTALADGRLAAVTDEGLFVLSPGGKRFAHVRSTLGARQPLQQRKNAGPDAPVYIVEQRGVRALESLERYDRPGPNWIYRQNGEMTGSALADRSGALWYDTPGAIFRTVDPAHTAVPAGTHHAPGTQRFGVADGLSGPLVVTFVEDADGNVWVATDGGIDRFREANVVWIREPFHMTTMLVPVPGAGVFATTNDALLRVRNDGTSQALPVPWVDFAVPAADGMLLVHSHSLSWRSRDGRRLLRELALPTTLGPVETLRSVAEARDGSVWISVIGGGVLRHANGRWERPAQLPDGGHKTPMTLFADARGRVWIGYEDNTIVLLDGARQTTFGAAQGLALGRLAAFAEYGGAVIAAGAEGVARLDGTRVLPLRADDPQALRNVTGICAGPEGVWLNGGAGVVFLDAAALASGGPVRVRTFGDGEGLRGRSTLPEHDTLRRADDGRVWASTPRGLFVIAPHALRREPVPRAPSVTEAEADGRTLSADAPLRLAASPQRVVLHYAAPALSIPDHLHYRYRLEGYDRGWQDAGKGTQAVYTGLPPGDYRFVVQAFNGAQQAGPASVPLALHVAPTLTQHTWFRIACALAVIAALWMVYRRRLATHAQRLVSLERTRSEERTRIARELHDTLLQSVQGLILRFDAAARRLPAGDPVRKALDAALERADETVAEARDRVLDLRGTAQQAPDVTAAVAACIAAIDEETQGSSTLHIAGTPYPLSATEAETCCRILTEALRNAHTHAGASRVEVTVDFAPGTVRIVVADDGRGIDGDVLLHGRPGHWGIAGMRERAAEAGGTVCVRSRPGEGTVVVLEMPVAAVPARQKADAVR